VAPERQSVVTKLMKTRFVYRFFLNWLSDTLSLVTGLSIIFRKYSSLSYFNIAELIILQYGLTLYLLRK